MVGNNISYKEPNTFSGFIFRANAILSAGRPFGAPSSSTSVFDCGANFEINIELMCNGVDNCLGGGGFTRSGSDELSGICDSKSCMGQ